MPKIEVCIDSLESLHTANHFALDRIELCAALSLGGTSPSYGLLTQAITHSTHSLAVMVRIRAGDFLYNEAEIQGMIDEIRLAKDLGIKHIVIGALTPSGTIDLHTTERFIRAAEGMEITFHRAFDLCHNPFTALEQLIALGCHRVLTSGQALSAFEGIPLLQALVKLADNRIQIMAGGGVNENNVQAILQKTQAPEIHFSAKGYRRSAMHSESFAIMGQNAEQDRQMAILDPFKLTAILEQIRKGKDDETQSIRPA